MPAELDAKKLYAGGWIEAGAQALAFFDNIRVTRTRTFKAGTQPKVPNGAFDFPQLPASDSVQEAIGWTQNIVGERFWVIRNTPALGGKHLELVTKAVVQTFARDPMETGKHVGRRSRSTSSC